MKFLLYSLALLVLMAALPGCNDGSDDSSSGVESVTFLDNGAVSENPVSTTIIFKSGTAQYSQTQSGKVINGWSADFDATYFLSFQQIIADHGLLKQENIVLKPGQTGCEGWRGMAILIGTGSASHEFTISGDVCRDDLPEGVRELIEKRDAFLSNTGK
jgi:hypothetical protein